MKVKRSEMLRPNLPSSLNLAAVPDSITHLYSCITWPIGRMDGVGEERTMTVLRLIRDHTFRGAEHVLNLIQ